MKPDLVRALRSALLCVIVSAGVVAIVCALGCTCVRIAGNGNTLTDIGGDTSMVPQPREARPLLRDYAEPLSARP
ncbi:hypothetical protein OKW33_006436 [Paraburkholderia atlantica]|uniref:Uncharacterized protein n=1 Tax=Paraburkholderia atlantica TaxID=2654982 RepID=A0A6I1QF23_PARAM|nr:hypothetical protein [Paraburkholderia atlantica]MBB5429784.1 hypothetical protein [Paraburkholderia atlantica]MPW11632.1 hypothetical protein [Paraburkholderia atlantica]NUY36043.1 hypothetical protein [Paraburkholderia atlantica]